MDIIERIIAGHRDIREKEDILGKLVSMIDTDAFFWDNAVKVSRFFDAEIFKHMEMEEKVLFPVLMKVIPDKEKAVLLEVEKEHPPIREKIKNFTIIAESHNRFPSKFTRQEMVKASTEILDIVFPHSEKEDAAVLPLIRKYFSVRDYRELEERYFKFLGV